MSSSTETSEAAVAPNIEAPGASQIPAHPSVPMVSLLLVALLAAVFVLAGAGGGFYYLARAGKLPGSTTPTAPKPVIVAPAATHLVVMEPLVVNLADPGGRVYLRLVATLRVEDLPEAKAVKAKPEEKSKDGKGEDDDVAAVRDTMLTVLGTQTSESLLEPDGKERLKSELKAALASHVDGMKVKEVYFTEFLVQR